MNRIRLDNKDFYYQVFYKRIKNMYLRIDSDNNLVVSCNRTIGKTRIEAFILSNQERILKKVAEKTDRIPLYSEGVFPLFGKEIPLTINLMAKRNAYSLTSESMTIDFRGTEPSQTYIEKIYGDSLKETIDTIITERRKEIERYFDIADVVFKTQLMKSRFGSCIPQKKIIKLNTVLARFPKHYLEAILMHELVHLQVPHHQQDFYTMLEALVPNYRHIRRKLQKLSRKYVI